MDQPPCTYKVTLTTKYGCPSQPRTTKPPSGWGFNGTFIGSIRPLNKGVVGEEQNVQIAGNCDNAEFYAKSDGGWITWSINFNMYETKLFGRT
eukprot:UN11832